MVQVGDGGDSKETLQEELSMTCRPRAREDARPKRVPGLGSLEDLSWKK